MDDEVRISEKQFRNTYAAGFETWAQLYSLIVKDAKLPSHCFFTKNTFPLLPTFPQSLELEEHSNGLTASGFSTWGSLPAKCARCIPSFRRRVQLEVAVKDPVLLSISDLAPTDSYSTSWFNSQNDYVTVLVLAWTYILSARWAEIMSPACSLTYTNNLAKHYDATTISNNPQHFIDSISTFSEAFGFLSRFCTRHNIVDQSHAALAAVLLLPCNTNGIRPLLLSIFYEPSIECNAVTPWLQGTLAAIESLAGEKLSIFGRMCMERRPEVACIWLGSAILGLQPKLLQDVKYGQIPIDLDSAAWTGTIQSFIQQPVSRPLTVNGYIQRADECRLLFLCQSKNHTRTPICQWKPFGKTPKDDVDLEVKVHEHCEGHGLQYQEFVWDCTEGELKLPSLQLCPHGIQGQPSIRKAQCTVPVVWKGLNHEKEAISENATRNIFSWLRSDGYAPCEKAISKHEWFMTYDSDEEQELIEEKTSMNDLKDVKKIEEWLTCSKESLL
ncbi:hypothetical protein COCSADRAFT_197610 [Bipolaris sorokiniana ND90Pr]|uniref:Uncharacterized protein n=1 Tax=Cochliobolus sativus (strain ND90Pr / ATCC 201652) TaxID=665912 RepID=M2RH94_COCSN|nr:uncharacterized protein COCSADRAFT_197610 [Bipolaris sorokiniana ND90Pr]EMD66084.1 hypothetical protein COCSADRAFT_197610 [Bipolaris sorokiniana ND90Pr]